MSCITRTPTFRLSFLGILHQYSKAYQKALPFPVTGTNPDRKVQMAKSAQQLVSYLRKSNYAGLIRPLPQGGGGLFKVCTCFVVSFLFLFPFRFQIQHQIQHMIQHNAKIADIHHLEMDCFTQREGPTQLLLQQKSRMPLAGLVYFYGNVTWTVMRGLFSTNQPTDLSRVYFFSPFNLILCLERVHKF